MKEVRTRFAPSPTGYMHIGNLRTALYAYLFAKKEKGSFILRIEDTDDKRQVKEALKIIYDTLADAGIQYTEGPDKGGQYGPYIQSERKAIYKEYAEKLVEMGGAYYCFCNQERLNALKNEKGITKYDKHCLHLSKEEIATKLAQNISYVIRQNIPEEGIGSYMDLVYGEVSVNFQDIEDGILLKSDGMPTYNFANVIDDHLMQISHVIRGSEYLSSTPKYNLLYDAFGWERPQYMHLPPIMKNATQKMSKRNGDASYQDLIAQGFIKEAIINYIALLGWSPKSNIEKMSLEQLEELFDIHGLQKSPSIFDIQKLKWLSGCYIKEMEFDTFKKQAIPFLKKSKVYGKYDIDLLLKLVQTRVDVLDEIAEKLDFIEEYSTFDSSLYFHKKMKSDREIAKTILPKIVELCVTLPSYDNATIYEALCQFAADNGYKNSQVLWTVRVALTGRESSPGGASEICQLLGKEGVLNRLQQAILFLKDEDERKK